MKIFVKLLILLSVIVVSCRQSKQISHSPSPKPVVINPSPKPSEEKPKEKEDDRKELNIALLLPLYLDQNFSIDTAVTEIDIEPRSLHALAFYEGAMVAIDSLKKENIKVNLNVFDIASDSSAKHFFLMKYQVLKKYDLIFANFPSSQAQAVADAAKQFRIKTVLTQFGNDALLKNNQNITLAIPSTLTQCRLTADYITNEFYDSNIIVFFRNVKRENELANVFKNQTDSLLRYKFNTETNAVLLNYPDSGIKVLKNYLSFSKKNIIFFPSSDESYVSSALAGLDTANRKITVVGLPTWENFESINFSKMENIEFYIFSGTFLNYDDNNLQLLRKKFINQFKTDPPFTAYQGFYLTLYFSNQLSLDEKNFTEHKPGNLYYTPLHFLKNEINSGYENNAISILKFHDYRFLKVNK